MHVRNGAPRRPFASGAPRGRYEGELTSGIKSDMARFIEMYEENNPEWDEILQHLRAFRMEGRRPGEIIQVLRSHYGIG